VMVCELAKDHLKHVHLCRILNMTVVHIPTHPPCRSACGLNKIMSLLDVANACDDIIQANK
jgi:hypothetical protein